MKKLILLLFIVFIGCKTQSAETKTETKTEVEKQEQTTENRSGNVKINHRDNLQALQDLSWGYNFNLKSTDANKPAVVTEYRDGKPYRTVVAQNAEYTENKAEKESSKHEDIKDYSADFSLLKTQNKRQNTTINELKSEMHQVKTDSLKISDNIKYLLWLLLAFVGIWIAERSGLFRLLKKLLNGL